MVLMPQSYVTLDDGSYASGIIDLRRWFSHTRDKWP